MKIGDIVDLRDERNITHNATITKVYPDNILNLKINRLGGIIQPYYKIHEMPLKPYSFTPYWKSKSNDKVKVVKSHSTRKKQEQSTIN